MIYMTFPFLAAMCYGLAYAFTESALKLTNVGTYMLLSVPVSLFIVIGIVKIKGEPITWAFTNNIQSIIIVAVAVIAPSVGWLFTTYAIKNVNASYTAFAEISYPLFTLLFLALFFGLRHFDWTLLLGGGLIIIGSSILVMGQISKL